MGTHTDVDELREALFGRSVVSVQLTPDATEEIPRYGPTVQGEVRLDDGRVLQLAGNVGGCVCSAGDYDLTQLNELPINGITDVQVEDEGEEFEGPHTYRLFVLAQDDRIELATFEGDDGNGYYGTGFWFAVVDPL